MEIDVSNQPNGDDYIVRITGSIDASCSSELKEQLGELLRQGHTALLLDLSQVKFVDSSGLGVIVGIYKAARASGGSLKLTCLRDPVRKVFALTHLDRIIQIVPRPEAA